MKINVDTKIMLRFHHKPSGRGLNLYNNYFRKTDTDAVYIMAQGKDQEKLLSGLRDLNYAGAIAAGFETDPEFAKKLDELSEVSKRIGKVGIVINKNGKLVGHYQCGEGLLDAISEKYDLNKKKLVILGAGGVAEALLYELVKRELDVDVTLVNRTLEKAEKLAEKYDSISEAVSLDELESLTGDLLLNATSIGASYNEGEEYLFKKEFLNSFEFIADVTFMPLESELIKLADELKIDNMPGYEMFTYQGAVCLQNILGVEVDIDVLMREVKQELK